jgi:hypothetical protein
LTDVTLASVILSEVVALVEEKKWLNEHHAEVESKVGPLLEGKDMRALASRDSVGLSGGVGSWIAGHARVSRVPWSCVDLGPSSNKPRLSCHYDGLVCGSAGVELHISSRRVP